MTLKSELDKIKFGILEKQKRETSLSKFEQDRINKIRETNNKIMLD